MRRKLVIALVALTAFAGSSFSLTWEEAVKLSETRSNSLRSARKQFESSEWSYRQALSTYFPQLSASAGMTETLSATSSASSRSYSYGLSATQYLFKGLDDVYSVQRAYNDVEQKRVNLILTKASALYEVRSSFINLYIAEENVYILKNILDQRKKNTELIRLRYESGREDKGNYLTTRADEASAEHDLSAAKRDLELARLKLSQLLDEKVESAEVVGEIPLPKEEDLDGLANSSPSMVLAKKELEASEIAKRASISGFLPSVSLSGNYRKSGSDWPPDSENRSWSLNFSYPFFPGGSNIAAASVTAAQLDKAREDFSASVKDLRYDIQSSYQEYEDAVEALKVAETVLEAGRERGRITEAKYLNGLVGYDEWYRIENGYIQSQKNLLSANKRALAAQAAWHKAYGGWVE